MAEQTTFQELLAASTIRQVHALPDRQGSYEGSYRIDRRPVPTSSTAITSSSPTGRRDLPEPPENRQGAEARCRKRRSRPSHRARGSRAPTHRSSASPGQGAFLRVIESRQTAATCTRSSTAIVVRRAEAADQRLAHCSRSSKRAAAPSTCSGDPGEHGQRQAAPRGAALHDLSPEEKELYEIEAPTRTKRKTRRSSRRTCSHPPGVTSGAAGQPRGPGTPARPGPAWLGRPRDWRPGRPRPGKAAR